MHLLVYTGQVSRRLNDKIFSRVGVLYNLKCCNQSDELQHCHIMYDICIALTCNLIR